MMNKRWFAPLLMLTLTACDDGEEPTDKPPPPISGGTLLITDDGKHAIAADADHDRVWIVDIARDKVAHEVPLREGDEPGRLAHDADGRVHVALRAAGALVSIDIATGKIVRRQDVCAAPRGVAYEAALDTVHVACLGGQLLTLRAADGEELRSLDVERDLRDIVVDDGGLMVSRFRSAEVLRIDALGNLASRSPMSALTVGSSNHFEPAVAWRMRSLPGGGAVVVHQRAMVSSVRLPAPGVTGGDSAYNTAGGSSEDPGIVHTTVRVIRPIEEPPPEEPEVPSTPLVPLSTLPVDVAVSADGGYLAIASAGAGTVITFPTEAAEGFMVDVDRWPVHGQPVAVAFDSTRRVWVQTRRPAGIHIVGEPLIPLGEEPEKLDGAHAAHDLFHLTTGDLGSMACASCHPEGGDDGRVWSFIPHDRSTPVLRRTQNLRGGLTDGPYHWDGALADFGALVEDVMVGRMGAADPGAGRTSELADWLIAMTPLPPARIRDPDSVDRGRELFHASHVGCADCHNGFKYTNDETVSVGTGEPLQVPTLIGIANHAPFMHDGCAKTLRERFGPCGGGDAHGKTSHLTEQEIADLIAYLETL